jgi:dUTP pyrophosphatase
MTIKEPEILIERLDKDLPLPKYAKPGDAGFDIYASVDAVIKAGMRALIPTGLSLALPPGYVALVHPRSGLAIKHGISMVNAPGTVDAGFRGELQIILINTDLRNDFEIHRGDRIAQIVIQEVAQAKFVEVERLPGSTRGDGGFGSTGVK